MVLTHSCILATINARRNVRLYMCDKDVRTGPWVPAAAAHDKTAREGTRVPPSQQYSGMCMYTLSHIALDWAPTHDAEKGALLVTGARDGTVTVWRVTSAHDMQAIVTHHVPGRVRLVQWSAWQDAYAHVAVHHGTHLTRYRVSAADPTRWEKEGTALIGAATITGMTWHDRTWHGVTPGGLWTWKHEASAPSCVALTPSCAHAAGSEASTVLLDDGRRYAWDGTLQDTLPISAPLWGHATQHGLQATLCSADDREAWRYMISGKLTYTLSWGHSPPMPTLLGPPNIVWRAWMLAYLQGAPCNALWSFISTSFHAVEAEAHRLVKASAGVENMAAWAHVHKQAQTLAWWAHWASSEAITNCVPPKLAWLAQWTGSIRAALACPPRAPTTTGYRTRLAAVLWLCAQDSQATAEEVACLSQWSEHIAPEAYQTWQSQDALTLDEPCPACAEPISFSLGPYARCPAGHVMDRCVATWMVMDSVDTWTCTGCQRSAQAAVVLSLSTSYPSITSCSACGNRWRAP
ncbi:hypothetical protein ACI68E_004237 [Malassezia pachydermatis]